MSARIPDLGRALIVAAATLLALPPPARGQDAGAAMTAAEAARRALAHHPDVAARRAGTASAEARVRERRAELLPGLSLSAGATRYQEPMVVTPIHGFTPGMTPPFDETLLQGSGHLTWTVYDGGGRGARIRGARSGLDAARADEEGAELELLERVAGTYLSVLGTARVLEAHDRRVDALRAELERARRFVEVGRGARVELLRVEAALAAARARRVELATELDLEERTLGRLVGLPASRVRAGRLSPVAAPSGPMPDADTLYARAVEAHPGLRALRSRIDGAEASVSAARSARLPRVEAGAHYVARGSDDHDPVGEWNAGLQLSLPVFTGGAVGSRVEQAEAERVRAREDLQSARLGVEDAVDRSTAAVREARARLESLESGVDRAAEVARIERLRLDTGQGVQTEYLDAEAALLDARAGLARARFGELGARVRVARIAGTLSVEWIRQVLGGTP